MDVTAAPLAPPPAVRHARRARPARVRPELDPQLSVVIVNYRQWPATADLVRRLCRMPAVRSGAAEVVVVDNHSPSHPVVARLRRWPGVSLRRWGRNRGFAAAVNEGARLSRGSWLLLLNPDVAVDDDFLDHVRSLIAQREAEDPRAGVVGLGLRNSDGSPQPSCGRAPTFAGTLAGLALPRGRRKYELARGSHPRRVGWVTGCGALVRRDCFRDLGGLDRDFFLYYEDVDFCRRARAHGYTVTHAPTPRLFHLHPLHGRAVSPLVRLLTRHALLTYADKHWPRWQLLATAAVVRAEAWLKQRLTRWRGDVVAAEVFRDLGALGADLASGHKDRARRRLERAVRREEARGDA